MTADHSLTPDYFDRVYAAEPDPWRFESSDYERDKYAATVAALPEARYRRGFEIGCSIGVLTRALAARCDSLLSVDVSERALSRTRERCRDLDNIEVEAMRVPEQTPPGKFDLIVVSEVGYYWSRADLERAVAWMLDAALPGATLLFVHWTHAVHDYPLSGDEVHEVAAALAAARGCSHVRGERQPDYRLDAWRAPGAAVAATRARAGAS